MAADPITAAMNVGELLIKRIWPDPAQQADALFKLKQLEQNGELAAMQGEIQVILGQLEINKIEAASDNIFKSGWRPAVGWVCVFALAYKFIIAPFFISAIQVIGYYTSEQVFPLDMLPNIDWTDLFFVLGGILGLGKFRSDEVIAGKR